MKTAAATPTQAPRSCDCASWPFQWTSFMRFSVAFSVFSPRVVGHQTAPPHRLDGLLAELETICGSATKTMPPRPSVIMILSG